MPKVVKTIKVTENEMAIIRNKLSNCSQDKIRFIFDYTERLMNEAVKMMEEK